MDLFIAPAGTPVPATNPPAAPWVRVPGVTEITMTALPTPKPGDPIPESDDSTLPATHIYCIECGTYQPVNDTGGWTDCDEALMRDEDHPVQYVHMTTQPLGYDDDRDVRIPGDEPVYVYPAPEPE